MMEQLKLLIKLQEIDTTIQKLADTKAKLAREKSNAQADARRMKQSLQTDAKEIKSAKMAIDKQDGSLRAIEEKIKKLSSQLNTVRTNKEYAAIQHEIMDARADKSKIEDGILALMDEVESRQQAVKELETRTARAETELAQREQAIDNALRDAENRIARLKEERKQLTQQIPQNILQPYERLNKGTRGQALSACRNFVCERCRMSLTANTVNLLMAGHRLVYCQSCSRILYLPEDEDTRHGEGAGRK